MVGGHQIDRSGLRFGDFLCHRLEEGPALIGPEFAQVFDDVELAAGEGKLLYFLAGVPTGLSAAKPQPSLAAIVSLPVTGSPRENLGTRRFRFQILDYFFEERRRQDDGMDLVALKRAL